jgi:hypothetical protein
MAKKDELEQRLMNEESEGEGGGKGGRTGEIAFRYHDVLSSQPRDDVFPEAEIRRLLIVQEELHKQQVDKQKITRKERDDIKKGRVQSKGYDGLGLRKGGSGGMESVFDSHPTLSKTAQFSGGIDNKVTSVPSDSLAETNDDIKQQLLAQLQLRFGLRQQPTLTHTNAPKLRRF